MAAADARARPRSRVVARVLVHAAQVVGLVVLLRAFADSPSVRRFAASFLSPQRLGFLAVNAIVITLAAISIHGAASSSPSSADPSGSHGAASSSPSSADPSGSPSSDADAQHPFLALLDPPEPLPPITEAQPSGEKAPPPPPPPEVFEDKQAVNVKKVRAQPQPPRRTVSEKTRAVAAAGPTSTAKAASPELRRAKSENVRRRQRRSAAAAAPAELGMDDAEAFRQAVEAFIAKQQTWFHREESLVARAAAAAANRGGGGDDGPAIAGAAAVAVK